MFIRKKTIPVVVFLISFFSRGLLPILYAQEAEPLQSGANRKNSTSTGIKHEDVKKILPQFDTYVAKTFEVSGVPGMALAVAFQDQILYLKTFGVRTAGMDDPVDPDTVFQLASISKSFTSLTIASLVGKGKLDWDDNVIDHYPEFRLYDPWVANHITIRDLLSHDSGLPEHSGDFLHNEFNYPRKEVIRRLRFLPPVADFRTTYAYQNYLISVAAECASRATGKEWPDIMSEYILKPLGMESTSSLFSDYKKAENKASSHILKDGRMTPQEPVNDDDCTPAGGVALPLMTWLTGCV